MKHAQDIELIVSSLNRERNDLLLKVAEIDKVIKRIRYGGLNLGLSKAIGDDEPTNTIAETQDTQAFPVLQRFQTAQNGYIFPLILRRIFGKAWLIFHLWDNFLPPSLVNILKIRVNLLESKESTLYKKGINKFDGIVFETYF